MLSLVIPTVKIPLLSPSRNRHHRHLAMPTLSPDETAFLERGKDTGKHIAPVNHLPMLIAGDQWVWPDGDKGQWQVVTGNYQDFYNKWRSAGSGSKFLNEFPYQLSLGQDARNKPLLPFHSDDPIGHRLLVTRSYNDLFHHILEKRRMDEGVTRGVVLTGQPGVGVSRPDPYPL
jgi:hypothetical protein